MNMNWQHIVCVYCCDTYIYSFVCSFICLLARANFYMPNQSNHTLNDYSLYSQQVNYTLCFVWVLYSSYMNYKWELHETLTHTYRYSYFGSNDKNFLDAHTHNYTTHTIIEKGFLAFSIFSSIGLSWFFSTLNSIFFYSILAFTFFLMCVHPQNMLVFYHCVWHSKSAYNIPILNTFTAIYIKIQLFATE